MTSEEKQEGDKAKEALELEQGEDGEDGGSYKTQSQFHTHLKKAEVSWLPSFCLVKGTAARRLKMQSLHGSHVLSAGAE